MLTPEIMPETWAFSEKAVRFENHYGGSNGTRQSLFPCFMVFTEITGSAF